MVLFALNVRSTQLSKDGAALRVARQNHYRALRLVDHEVVLYRPRDEAPGGYFGMAQILGVEVDISHPDFIWLELRQTLFPKVVGLDDIYDGSRTKDAPFHTYSKALRVLNPYERLRLSVLVELNSVAGFQEPASRPTLPGMIPKQWNSRKVILRKRLLRAQMLRLYGPACVFTDETYSSLNGRLFSTEVGHLMGLGYGGPDVIQNILPMGRDANWHWEHGLISLSNAGLIMLSSRASSATRRRFQAGKQVRYTNSQFWPKAEYLEWHRDTIFERGPQPELTRTR